MTEAIFDGSGFETADIGLAVLITLSSLITYARIAFEVGALRLPVPRMIVALGFTVWALRFWVTIYRGGDVIVAPVSMVAIAMITVGYSVVQLYAIRRAIQMARVPLFCFRDPEWPCQREDRIQEAILREMKK